MPNYESICSRHYYDRGVILLVAGLIIATRNQMQIVIYMKGRQFFVFNSNECFSAIRKTSQNFLDSCYNGNESVK